MMRLTAVLIGVVGLFGASAARADSVEGTGAFFAPCEGGGAELCPYMRISINASSGPDGENPTGTGSYWTVGPVGGGGSATKVCVSGNTAIVNFEDPYALVAEFRYYRIIVNDGTPDVMYIVWSGAPLTDCSSGGGLDFGPHTVTQGGFSVVDTTALTPAQQIDAEVPCSGPAGTDSAWKNHGQYMRSVAQAVNAMIEDGIVTDAEADALVSERAQGQCGQ